MSLYYPKSRDEWLALRHKYVSSTEVSALFGVSRYLTAFELALVKQDKVPSSFEASERSEWGLYLQLPVAKKFADDYGIKVRALNAYAVHEDAGMGASFDYEIVGVKDGEAPKGDVLRDMWKTNGPGVLEIKTVDYLIFRDQWHEDKDGNYEAPAGIEIQVQQELHCIERKWAVIGVLVAGNQGHVLIRDYDADVGKALEAKCRAFWRDLKAGKLPPPTLPEDADIMRKIYAYAEPGKLLDAQDDKEIHSLCAEYADAQQLAKGAEDRKKTVQAKLLEKIGTAEKVLVDGFTISAGMVAPAWVERYERAGYRNLRVYTKKAEKVPKSIKEEAA